MKKSLLCFSLSTSIFLLVSSYVFAEGNPADQTCFAENGGCAASAMPGGDVCAVALGNGCPEDGVWDSVNGTVFWDGSEWKVNDVYAHMYIHNPAGEQPYLFIPKLVEVPTSAEDIERPSYGPVPPSCWNSPENISTRSDYWDYALRREIYTYSIPAAVQPSGALLMYTYEAIQYNIYHTNDPFDPLKEGHLVMTSQMVAQEAVDIPDGGRKDFAGHQGLTASSSDAIGMV